MGFQVGPGAAKASGPVSTMFLITQTSCDMSIGIRLSALWLMKPYARIARVITSTRDLGDNAEQLLITVSPSMRLTSERAREFACSGTSFIYLQSHVATANLADLGP